MYVLLEFEFDNNLLFFRPIITVVLPDAMHTSGYHRVYISGICLINLLTPNVNYSGRTAPLTSKVAFYIFIQQI